VAALLAAQASVAAADQPLPRDPLWKALGQSLRDGKAIVVFFQAEWCEPCNELEAQVFESPRGAPLLARVHVVRYEFDSALGQIASQQFAVMSLPTSLVLRVRRAEGASATPLAYREVARIEGFDDAPSWLATMDAALRRDPSASRSLCDAWKGKTGPGHWELLPCAETHLRDLAFGGEAAAWIEPRVTGTVPPQARKAARDAARALLRYWLRVRGDAGRCADLAARTQQLAADDPEARAGFVYWHALCLRRAGQTARAAAVLEEHIARAGASPKAVGAARLLAADLLVHERIEPARARAFLQLIVKQEPRNDEAYYLWARLLRDQKQLKEARALVAKARALAPQKALYRHFEEGLGKGR
jgi:thiol-disulfide isomerase/thioredoxin